MRNRGAAALAARAAEAATGLRRPALSDAVFREICEEYALAQESLAAFEARHDVAERPEVGDYRTIIAAIEGENRPAAAVPEQPASAASAASARSACADPKLGLNPAIPVETEEAGDTLRRDTAGPLRLPTAVGRRRMASREEPAPQS